MGHLKGTGLEGGMDDYLKGVWGGTTSTSSPCPILSLEKCLCEPLKVSASMSDQCGLGNFYKACDLRKVT